MPTCPNCGNKQQGTSKCAKCGSLFAYYTIDSDPTARKPGDNPPPPVVDPEKEEAPSFWKRVKKAAGVREQ